MDVMRKTAVNAEKRKRKIDDVQKRNSYRIAHGLMDKNAFGLGPWTPESDEDSFGARPYPIVDKTRVRPVGVEPGKEVEVEKVIGGDRWEGPLNEMDERKKPVIRKWFGIAWN